MRGQDLLTALADELKGLAPELVSAYDAGSPGDDAYLTSVSRLSEAAGYMGLSGVQRIGSCVTDNLQHLDSEDQDARVLVRPFFTEWAQLLEAHLPCVVELLAGEEDTPAVTDPEDPDDGTRVGAAFWADDAHDERGAARRRRWRSHRRRSRRVPRRRIAQRRCEEQADRRRDDRDDAIDRSVALRGLPVGRSRRSLRGEERAKERDDALRRHQHDV